MKRISLDRAHEILENAEAVIVYDSYIITPKLSALTGEDDNEFLYLEWVDAEGLGYAVKFEEGSNEKVEIRDGEMILIDVDNGEEMELKILVAAQL